MIKDKKVITFAITIVSLFTLCAGLIIGIEYIKNDNIYFVFKNLIIISYTLTSLLTIIGLIKYLNPISIILIVFHCICLFGQLYFIPYRLYYKILTITTIITILYTITILVIKVLKKANIKHKFDVPLLNAFLPTIIIFATYFMKTFYLMDTVEIISDNILSESIIIGMCVAVLALILYIVLRKNKSDKKDYFGAMIGVFFGTLIVISFLVFGTINNVNYGFDSSESTKEYYVITNKEERINSKSRNGYYIIIIINGEELKMKVNKLVYNNYQIDDEILLYEHQGALGYSYYEYQMESIYIYANNNNY